MRPAISLIGLSIGKLSNAVMGVVMSLERALIRMGLRFRLGGSLLVIAKKPIFAKNN